MSSRLIDLRQQVVHLFGFMLVCTDKLVMWLSKMQIRKLKQRLNLDDGVSAECKIR